LVRRKALGSPRESKITEKSLLAIAEDLKSQKVPMARLTVSDDLVTGLRAMISNTGEVSYHASYSLRGERPFLFIGSANKKSPDYISLSDARELTKTIKALADKGVDVKDGLMPRLRRELLKDGEFWRPK
jgi:hypothetical protein